MEPRNYAANADAAPPAAPGVPSNGYPRAADPGTGLEATIPGPHWFYKVGESLRKVITDQGLVPDDTDLSLLSKAITGQPGAANAWISYDGTNNTIRDSFNVLSLGNDGVGINTITFIQNMPNENYSALASCLKAGGDPRSAGASVRTVSSVQIITQLQPSTAENMLYVDVSVHAN